MQVTCGGKTVDLVPTPSTRQQIEEPKRCPECGEPTTRTMRGKTGAVTYCSSTQCPAVSLGKVDHWIGTSKKGTGILGIGDTILKALWDNRLVNDAADLYTLTVDQMKDIELDGGGRIGESRSAEIVKNIASKKTLPLNIFLGSLGIDLLGRRRVEILKGSAAGQLDTLDDWLDNEKLATLEIPGFGDTIRDSIRKGIDECRPLIEKLRSVGVTIKDETREEVSEPPTDGDGTPQPVEGKPFVGLSFCLTGTRAYIGDIERLGGTVKSGVSKAKPSPDFLVQKDPTSSSNKTKNAEANGHTQIISLDYLKRAVDGEVTLAALSP